VLIFWSRFRSLGMGISAVFFESLSLINFSQGEYVSSRPRPGLGGKAFVFRVIPPFWSRKPPFFGGWDFFSLSSMTSQRA